MLKFDLSNYKTYLPKPDFSLIVKRKNTRICSAKLCNQLKPLVMVFKMALSVNDVTMCNLHSYDTLCTTMHS